MFIFTSCLPKNKMKYITKETGKSDFDYTNYRIDKTIKPQDRLYVKILSLDEKTTRIFREETRLYGELDLKLNSYEVDESGDIDFPFVGKIHVGGYTIAEAREKLEKEISQYLPNTAINLKYAGNYVTVLGEVRNPGNHLFFEEKINIFEALGHAGGIRDYGNKKEIIIVRTENDETRYHEVDITHKGITQTYYYYLLPDDIIIVQPLNAKFKTLRNFQLESMFLSSITTVITVLYFFHRN
jgi:polysaccharide export outer membrane protein